MLLLLGTSIAAQMRIGLHPLRVMLNDLTAVWEGRAQRVNEELPAELKPLAVTTPARSPQLPDVPTLSEAGVRGADMSTWYALYVTAGTPADVVTRLQNELARVLKLPDVEARLKGLGGEVSTMTAAQFAELNRQEFERFGKLIRDAGIKLQ